MLLLQEHIVQQAERQANIVGISGSICIGKDALYLLLVEQKGQIVQPKPAAYPQLLPIGIRFMPAHDLINFLQKRLYLGDAIFVFLSPVQPQSSTQVSSKCGSSLSVGASGLYLLPFQDVCTFSRTSSLPTCTHALPIPLRKAASG